MKVTQKHNQDRKQVKSTADRILMIAYAFPPRDIVGSQRPAFFAEYLSDCGYEIDVIKADEPPDVIINQELLTKLKGKVSIISVLIPKFLTLPHSLRWLPALIREGSRHLKTRRNCLILVTGGPFTSFMGAAFLSRTFRIPLILDYRDLWSTQRIRTLNWKGRIVRQCSRLVERIILHQSSRVIAVTNGMRDVMLKHFPFLTDKIQIIPNGHTKMKSPLEEGIIKRDKISILYTGKVYLDTAVEELIKALNLLRQSNPKLLNQFIIQIIGTVEPDLKTRMVNSRHAFEFFESMTVLKANQCQRKAGILLSFDKDPIGIPTKIYEYLGASRPILLITDDTGDTAQCFSGLKGIHVVNYLDPTAVAEQLEVLVGQVSGNREEVPEETTVRAFSRLAQSKSLPNLIETALKGKK